MSDIRGRHIGASRATTYHKPSSETSSQTESTTSSTSSQNITNKLSTPLNKTLRTTETPKTSRAPSTGRAVGKDKSLLKRAPYHFRTSTTIKTRRIGESEESDDDDPAQHQRASNSRSREKVAPKDSAWTGRKRKAKEDNVIDDENGDGRIMTRATLPPSSKKSKVDRGSEKSKRPKKLPEGQPVCLRGLSFVFSGELESMSRDEAHLLCKRYGGRVHTSPYLTTSYVVLGSGVQQRKLKMIAKNKLATLTEDAFITLIRTRSPDETDPILLKTQQDDFTRVKQAAKSGTSKESHAMEDEVGRSRPGRTALGSKDLSEGRSNCLDGLSFVFTGKLEMLSLEEAQLLCQRFGGEVTSRPNLQTSFVVVGSGASENNLEVLAKNKILTLTEQEFLELITPRSYVSLWLNQLKTNSTPNFLTPYARMAEPFAPAWKQTSQKQPQCLHGLSFVFTGKFKTLPFGQAERLCTGYGGRITPRPSSATSYIVFGPCASQKNLEFATQNKLPTITEDGFIQLIKTRLHIGLWLNQLPTQSNGFLSTGHELPHGQPNCLNGLSFVFTGTFESLSLEGVQLLCKQYGGRVTSGPSNKTSYIVLGSDVPQNHFDVIEKHNLSTLMEDEFLELVRTRSGN